MSKQELNIVDEPIVDEVSYAPDEVLAKIVKEGDEYFVIDRDGTKSAPLMITKDGISLILTPNASNRKFWAVKKADAAIEADGFVGLTYKGTKVLGPQGSRSTAMPNAKLIAYLSEEEQAEYKAIIDRAIAARDADKKKPMTEKEKLEAKIAKAKEALAKLEAEAAND